MNRIALAFTFLLCMMLNASAGGFGDGLGGGSSAPLASALRGATANRILVADNSGVVTTPSNLLFFPATGTMCIGGTCALNDPAGDATKPHLWELTNNATTQQVWRMSTYGTAGSLGGQNNMHFTRMGGTAESPTATQANDYFFSMGARGYGTSVTDSKGAIQWLTPSLWTGTSTETQFQIEGTRAGSVTRTRNMTLNGSGELTLTRNSSFTPYRTSNVFVIDYQDGSGGAFSRPFLMQIGATQAGTMVFGESTSNETYFARYGSSLAGNYTNSSVASANTTHLRAGPTANQGLYVGGTPVLLASGQTGTNAAVRVDATGIRVGTIANMHTANTFGLDVAGTTRLTGAVTFSSTENLNTCTLNAAATATCTILNMRSGCGPICVDTQPSVNGVAAIAPTISGTTVTATSSVASDGSIVRCWCP